MRGQGQVAVALLQHQHHQRRRRLEVEEEVRRQMFAGVAAVPVAVQGLGHAQQADNGEDAGWLGESNVGRSESEPAQVWQRGVRQHAKLIKIVILYM